MCFVLIANRVEGDLDSGTADVTTLDGLCNAEVVARSALLKSLPCSPSFACGQALPRNWMIFRRSRFEGLPAGKSSNCFNPLRSAATFRRSSRLASVSR